MFILVVAIIFVILWRPQGPPDTDPMGTTGPGDLGDDRRPASPAAVTTHPNNGVKMMRRFSG